VVAVVDRGTQTSLHDASHSRECDTSSPGNAAADTTLLVKCTQTVDVPPCPPLFNRSVYSGWSAPPQQSAPDAAAQPVTECGPVVEVDRHAEPWASDGSFTDSAADQHVTPAVRQCRQHVDDISGEAASLEHLLNELAGASLQRDRVLDAVKRLDRLRQHINATQQLLNNVDTMIGRCEQTQPQPQTSRSAAPSRTELLQRELGRLNSRLCCTVLALERATSKAICRGTRSGVVAGRSSVDNCCESAGLQQPSDTASVINDQPAVTSQSTPDAPAQTPTAVGVCEQWLNSQRQQSADPPTSDDCAPPQQHADLPSPVASQPSYPVEPSPSPSGPSAPPDDEEPTSESTQQQQQQQWQWQKEEEEMMTAADNTGDVSLQDIHRKLGDIISDIDQPQSAVDRDDLAASPRQTPAVDVASNPSVMTDSEVASSTDLQQTYRNQALSHGEWLQ